MKLKLVLVALPLLAVLVMALPAMAKPTTFTTTFNQAQYQWRAFVPLGTWYAPGTYQNVPVDSEYKLTGNVLHTAWSYSPVVTDLTGQSTVYTYDKNQDRWIEKEGQVSYKYVPFYGDYPIVNFFRGYMGFDGTPSGDNFEHGVAYQWVYLFAPNDVDLTPILPYAVWDEKVGAWLVGFSIYLWDSGAQTYNISPLSSFPEPVPASNYNPLEL